MSASQSLSLKVLFFDVFGTVVDWRSSVSHALEEASSHALKDTKKVLPEKLRQTASAFTTDNWHTFVQEWRTSYYHFTRTFDKSKSFVSVDQHHYDSLVELLNKWELEGLFTDDEVRDLALSWHRLRPWPDSVKGLERLNTKFQTCTLSNGNSSLLNELKEYGSLPFGHVASAEDFGAYKPSPLVYNGGAAKFGVTPQQCALVAAHLYDLKAAKKCGFYTIYVERPLEENLPAEEIATFKNDGTVDLWVTEEENGFLEVARRLGA